MDKKTIVIVGPHAGDMEIARLCEDHTEVWLIEPMPDPVQWLREHNGKNPNVHIVQAACGERSGKAIMTVYNNGLSSSLGKCTDQAVELYSKYDLSEQGIIEVDVINLCEFLESNGITEIETLFTDSQGMDLAILKTMESWLERGSIQTIICESDYDGFRHYDGVPANNVSDFLRYMSQFPQYEFRPDESKMHLLQPDLKWVLTRTG